MENSGGITPRTSRWRHSPIDVLTATRPTWRGRMHAITFFVAIPFGILLIKNANGARAITAASIYAASVLCLFGTSGAYHRLAHSPSARRVMRRLDHAMIFILIGGTYTPICLLALPSSWGIPMLAIAGVGSIGGFILKLAAFDRLKKLAYILYPMLGWIIVIAMPKMATRLSSAELVLIIAGGLVYTLGLPVLITRRPNPWPTSFGYHEVWHTCVVLASACHFAAVGLLVA
jgi:hemolysin III